jgi:hypothetical protein
MRLILSRKGFDASPACGGCASPILPDGQMISLPIPYDTGRTTFAHLKPRGHDVGRMVAQLTDGRVAATAVAHGDPDLEHSTRSRSAGWRPAFGQDGAAQRHLEGQGVGAGDLFLFFGWFREVIKVRGRYGYRPRARNRHVIFGWLKVGQVLRVDLDAMPRWLEDHPHAAAAGWAYNTIYVAANPEGGGIFPKADDSRTLTAADSVLRSVWRLPADFLPRGRPPLTYHGHSSRWVETADGCRLQTVAKGQEFVLNLDEYPGVRRWAEGLVAAAR